MRSRPLYAAGLTRSPASLQGETLLSFPFLPSGREVYPTRASRRARPRRVLSSACVAKSIECVRRLNVTLGALVSLALPILRLGPLPMCHHWQPPFRSAPSKGTEHRPIAANYSLSLRLEILSVPQHLCAGLWATALCARVGLRRVKLLRLAQARVPAQHCLRGI